MTEAEWLDDADPQEMLKALAGKTSDRKLRLFGCACCRRVSDLLTEDCFRSAVEVAERFADRVTAPFVKNCTLSPHEPLKKGVTPRNGKNCTLRSDRWGARPHGSYNELLWGLLTSCCLFARLTRQMAMGILADARSFLLRRRRFLQLFVSGVTGLFFQRRPGKGGLFARELATPPTNNGLVAERQILVHNLASIALAMHNYHDYYGRFPPAAACSADGQPLLSWRVLLLPFLQSNDLYGRFKLDEPWDSPYNRQWLGEMPSVYTSPGGRTTERFQTRYQIVTGAGTLFTRKDGPMLSDIRDGVCYTLLVVEAARAVPWTKPDDLVYAADQPLPRLGGLVPEGCYVALVEGTVHFIKKETDEETLRALITPADGKWTRWDPDSSLVYPWPKPVAGGP